MMLSYAINHMTAPGLRWDSLLELAAQLGCAGVEFRNDLPGPVFDGASDADVARAATQQGLKILALAEIKAFNNVSKDMLAQANQLMDLAAACSAQAVVLIPRNDGQATGKGERRSNLRQALRELGPRLAHHDLVGLVEPLGFSQCSLRDKAEIVDGIEALGLTGRVQIVHDTFHHALAGNGAVFPAHTGIVHISGVSDRSITTAEMQDHHRGLVDGNDRLGNVAQLRALRDSGFAGPVSFECFAPSVHNLTDRKAQISRSIEFIESQLSELAA